MFRSSLLLIRQTRLGCRHYLRKQRVDADPGSESCLKANLGRSLAFTVGTTTLFYTGATLAYYEDKRAAHFRRFEHRPKQWFHDLSAVEWWREQKPAKKIFYGILTANAVVFIMWQNPRFSNVMYKYFAHRPASNMVLPMFLSVFSHKSLLHLGCNMLVLNSFIDAAVAVLGKEQFLATYLSGGVVSAFVSHLGKLYTQNRAVSLGASGAILTALGYFCMAFPDSQMHILFLPMMTFKAITGIKGLMAFDAYGLLSKWSFIDHAAHLGGALFGIGYFLGGNQLYFSYSLFLIRNWDRIRSGERGGDK